MDKRLGFAKWGPCGTRILTSARNWDEPVAWNRRAEKNREFESVFCASLADVFEDRPELVEWRDALFQLISKTPMLLWMLLTKRPENINRMLPEWFKEEHWKNIAVGTSVENQDVADERIGHIIKVPARWRFLSCEPLLGPIDLDLSRNICAECNSMNVVMADDWGYQFRCNDCEHMHEDPEAPLWLSSALDVVIVGGESGRKARPMQADWVRGIRDQCDEAGVRFFFKQWGGVDKHAAGNTLDGISYVGPVVLAYTADFEEV